MSTEPPSLNGAQLREPIYFQSGNRALFGWLHTPLPAGDSLAGRSVAPAGDSLAPAGGSFADRSVANRSVAPAGDSLAGRSVAAIGIVICKPFGYEAVCSHRSVRTLVAAAVGVGTPVLTFDYLGCGDSHDIEPGADQLQVWTADVVAAVGELTRRTGVKQVCLLGLRLGATLAILAARHCPEVAALALVAPVIEGRRYVKELKTSQLVASLAAKSATERPARESPAGATERQAGPLPGSIEAGGYTLFPASVAALSQVDLNTPDAAPATRLSTLRMLVIDRDDVPSAAKWSERMAGLGAQVQYEALPGYVGMLMSAPQFAVTPLPIVAAFARWLEVFRPATDRSGSTPTTAAAQLKPPVPDTTVLRIPVAGADPSTYVTERPLWLGEDTAVFGIVTEPRQGEARRRGVIFINAGADYHTGAGRLHVGLAREWAAGGYVALRLDLAGIGDSDTRPGRPDDEVFPPAALDDMRAAIDLIRSRYAVGEITIGGICSGAYHSLRAAVAQLSVSRVLMVNPLNFFWDYRKTLQDVQLVDVVRDPGVYRERFRSLRSWRKVFSGEANIWRFSTVHFYRLFLSLQPLLRDIARAVRVRLPQDLGWLLKEMDARGVRTVIVFSRGEPGIELMRFQGGLSGKRFQNRCRIHIIDGADHTFTRSRPRAELTGVLSAELFTALDPQTPAEAGQELSERPYA
jgi:alpha-beta hydrolase superfamily lysophospholipase